MVKLSVGLPFFRSKYIGWAALESLCRQQDVDFEWELIVMEEHRDPEALGKAEIESYLPRLQAVGCSSFRYIPLDAWMPLGVKLNALIRHFSDTEVAIWNPDDYYAPPKLLKTAYVALQENTDVDWFSIPKTIFYNIADGSTLIYDVWATRKRRKDDSTGRAFRTSVLKSATGYFDSRKRVCDGMVRDSYKKALGRPINMFFDATDNWKCGLNIKGLNNISMFQQRWFRNVQPPLYKCTVNLNEFIPKEILDKLVGCRKYLAMHKGGTG